MNSHKIVLPLTVFVLFAALLPAASMAAPGNSIGSPAGLLLPDTAPAGAATVQVDPAAPASRPLEEFLLPDGTLALAGFRGSLDPRGYRLVSGPGEPPRFAQAPEGEVLAVEDHWDERFHPPGTDSAVNALLVDSDGSLYIGGNFSYVGDMPANHIAQWDGAAWSALGSGLEGCLPPRWRDCVRALAMDSSGTLYAGGYFATAGGVPVNYIARWDGTAWSALHDGTDGCVNALAVDGSGNLYAGGTFSFADNVPANNVARWDGASWSALGSGMDGGVNALAVDGSGYLYAGGNFTTAGGLPANYVARWDGADWSALGSGTNRCVFALAVDGDGTLYAGGDFTNTGGLPANHIALWNGATWSALGSGTNGYVSALVVDGSGNLYAGGDFTSAGGVPASHVARWDGAAWSALGSGLEGLEGWLLWRDCVRALAGDGRGYLYAGGNFTTAGGLPANYVARWDGAAWSALTGGGGMNGPVHALAGGRAGTLYAGGDFTYAGSVPANHVACWDGTAWSALGSGTNGRASALVVDGSGNLYAGGVFTSAGGVLANNIAKWDGTSWSVLGSGTNGGVSALVVDGSGNLYAGGVFTTAGGVLANNVARWDGTTWSALGSGLDGGVSALAVYDSGNVYAASGCNVFRWDGTVWSDLGCPYLSVTALTVDGSGGLYAGLGEYCGCGSLLGAVFRWDGTAWSDLGSLGNEAVFALALDGHGNLYAGNAGGFWGGLFSFWGHVSRWDGTAWVNLGTMDWGVHALALNGEGSLYAGGDFGHVDCKPSAHIARWFNTPPQAVNDGYATLADTPLVVPAPGVLANDSDPDGDPLPATLGLLPFSGTLELSSTGAFTYTPPPDFSGLVAFTYAITDGYGGIATATVVVRVGEPQLAGTLLVDDDGDSPDVRAYYTSALDHLGVAYEVWDTAAWGSPVAQVLQGRDNVLWFTGAGRADTFTAADEAVVGEYLDTAGHFFLSSEDYLHEMGLTAFGQDFLGIITYTDDVSQTDVVGSPGSPIGAGLGPYTLTLPPGWSALWTDVVSGTQSPFRWQGSGLNNSANYDGVHFWTVFLGWPLEGLADLDDRAEVLCAVLGWFGGCAGPCDPVQGADFTWAPVTPTVDLPVTFTGTVAVGDEPITYTWKLDVGTWKEGQVVTHTYNLPGVYVVAMTATNCATTTATASHTLTVVCPDVADAGFAWTPAVPEAGQVVTFTAAASSSRPLTYAWDLGDSSFAFGPLVTHTYAAPSTYTVILTASNDCGSWQAVTDTLTVTPTCQGVSIVSVTMGIAGCEVTFGAELSGTPPFTYLWDFGPFGTSTATNALVDFGVSGTYSGTVSVWNCGSAEPATSAFTVEVACSRWTVYLPLVLRGYP